MAKYFRLPLLEVLTKATKILEYWLVTVLAIYEVTDQQYMDKNDGAAGMIIIAVVLVLVLIIVAIVLMMEIVIFWFPHVLALLLNF